MRYTTHECVGPYAPRGERETAAAEWNAANAAPAPALLALARLGAWVAASHADEPGDIFAPNIEDAEDKFGVVVTHRPPVGYCALGGERGDDCPCSEYYGRDEQCECRLFAPGISDAIAALLAPGEADGADGADRAGDAVRAEGIPVPAELGESVCRWVVSKDLTYYRKSCGSDRGWFASDGRPGRAPGIFFCPSCGGRIEVTDG